MSGRAEKSDKTKWWRWGAAAGIAALLGCAIAVGATFVGFVVADQLLALRK